MQITQFSTYPMCWTFNSYMHECCQLNTYLCNRININIILPYSFKVTSTQNIGGNKGITKGLSVQCVETGISSPQIKKILEAYKRQNGIENTFRFWSGIVNEGIGTSYPKLRGRSYCEIKLFFPTYTCGGVRFPYY